MAPRPMRLLPPTTATADYQLAAGVAMLAGLEHGGPVLRWYAMERPALLLGMSQQRELLDEAACRAAGIAIHRRQSGGGVVLADERLLMLDLALPHGDPMASADLTMAYRWLGEAATRALESLGGTVRMVSIDEARADTRALVAPLKDVCFAGRSPYEVLAGERKIVGLAQVRRRPGALFQLGIYTRWEPQRTARLLVLAPEARPALEQRLGERVAGLADVVPAASMPELQRAVEQAIAERGGFGIAPDEWRNDELAALGAARARYEALDA
jgi:lipoate---protein ligase